MRILNLWLVVIVIGLGACKGERPLNRLSDLELVEKHKECVARKPTAPGAILACGNIKRECERRHEALGNYICAAK